MATWKVRKEKLEPLKRRFRLKGMYSQEDIAMATASAGETPRVSTSTVGRAFTGNLGITYERMQILFACLLGFQNITLSPEQTFQVDAEIIEYCEEILVVVKPKLSDQLLSPPPSTEERLFKAGGHDFSCITVYTKFIHLKDEGGAPAYLRFVARINEEIPVFSEILLVRTLYFRALPESYTVVATSIGGVADLQSVFPPRTHIALNYLGTGKEPGLVEHLERVSPPGVETDRLSQVAYLLLNRFGRGSEHPFVGSTIDGTCDRFVMVVDLTSLPIPLDRLLTSPPIAYHKRANIDDPDLLTMVCEQSHTGMFVIDSAKVCNGQDAPGMWNPKVHRLLGT